MTGSTTCDRDALAQAAADENYYTQRLKQALDARDQNIQNPKISDVNMPEHWTSDAIHIADLNVSTDQANLVTSMVAREAQVQSCVNELISFQQLDEAQGSAADGTSAALKVAENQRQDAIRSYNNMLSERDSKARIVEINTYYSKEYNAYTNILKLIFAFCIPLVILGMLNKEELIDDASYFRFSLLIIIIAFLMTIYRINDMYWRNNINFDNYEWLYSNPRKDDTLKRSLEGVKGVALSGGSATCKGAACCNSTTFWNGERCEVLPIHLYIGTFHYCKVEDDGSKVQHTVDFVPVTAMTGRIVGTAINGSYSVDRQNDNYSRIVIDRPENDFSAEQKTYSTTISEPATGEKKIVFTDSSPSTPAEANDAPKHNGKSTGTQWLAVGGTTPPTCDEIANA